jgi:hypothetical protein
VGLGIISFLFAMLVLSWYTKPWFFQKARSGIPTVFFGAPMTNVVGAWAFLNGIVGMFWFWFIYKKVNSKNGVTEEMIGWKMDRTSLLKTIGLSVVIITLVYTLIAGARWLFMVDFRIWTPALKTFRPDKLVTAIPYLPFFFVFYLANSLLINGAMRVDGMKEKLNVFICALGNILGCTTLWIIQYGHQLLNSNHNVIWGPEWIPALVINFCIPQLFVAALLNRYFFKATGKVWLGAMVNTFIWVFLGVMHTCITGIFV